jgi:hypothetical protein
MTNRTEIKIKEYDLLENVCNEGRYHISEHAISRFVQRVAPSTADAVALRILDTLVTHGHGRSTPRKWMRRVKLTPGLGFVYWSGLPDVCALTLGGTVITIVTRDMFRKKTRITGIDRSKIGNHETRNNSGRMFIFRNGSAA